MPHLHPYGCSPAIQQVRVGDVCSGTQMTWKDARPRRMSRQCSCHSCSQLPPLRVNLASVKAVASTLATIGFSHKRARFLNRKYIGGKFQKINFIGAMSSNSHLGNIKSYFIPNTFSFWFLICIKRPNWLEKSAIMQNRVFTPFLLRF